MKKGNIYIIAEIGCNHNGDKELARRMIHEAKRCGVDAVKFQMFKSSSLISKFAPKAEYQKKTTGEKESQLEMTKKLELSQKDYLDLRSEALMLGLDIFATPFDFESIEFLESENQNIWKIPSGEITNLPYLQKIANINCHNKQIFLSTGMSTLGEIDKAVDVLTKCRNQRDRIVLLHCNTEYPTPDEDVNLLSLLALKRHFPYLEVGFSDHSIGSVAAIAAAALGITVVEKHFTLDKCMVGPDHLASASPEELSELCNGVRRVEEMLGVCDKIITKSEFKNLAIARKSIVASCDIKKGEVFTPQNITCKRPGTGISPMHWYEVLGKVANRDFIEDELITL